jgi:hypothetical protein
MPLIALRHVGYHYMNSHLIHDQTFTGYPDSRMGCTQNYGHVKTVQSLFKLPESAFMGLVVFTGDAEFKSDPGPEVIHLSQLLEFVEHRHGAALNEQKMTYVVGRIEMKRLRRSLETDEYHLNYVRQRISRA